MFRSTSLRLAAMYTTAYACAVIGLGIVTTRTTHHVLMHQFEVNILDESKALTQEYGQNRLGIVIDEIKYRERVSGGLAYGLEDAGGRALAGRLAGIGAGLGWTSAHRRIKGGDDMRVFTTRLPGGYRLLVGDNDRKIEALNGLLARRFLAAFGGVTLVGILGGYGLSRGVARHIAAITRAAEGIIDGDLSHRVKLRGSADDLDDLATTFNKMLDRIQALMESLRQVSIDIAHDLRTPLARLRTRLEAGLADGSMGAGQAEAALADLDSILSTFAALLRIAQIEGGARRAAFRPTDMAGLARTVVEAFGPSAEEAGRVLGVEAYMPVTVQGDPELLTQLIVNLVENGLRHAGPAATIVVAVAAEGRQAVLSVRDNGPGIPQGEREKVFDRFYRLESSRSTEGSGLGLSLVAAVARLHQAEVRLSDGHPGLVATVLFPAEGYRSVGA